MDDDRVSDDASVDVALVWVAPHRAVGPVVVPAAYRDSTWDTQALAVLAFLDNSAFHAQADSVASHVQAHSAASLALGNDIEAVALWLSFFG